MKFETNERKDGRTPGIEVGASVTSGGNNFNEFPDNWPNFVYLLVDPGFYPPSLKFLKFIFFKLKHCGLFPHRIDAREISIQPLRRRKVRHSCM